MGQGHYHPVRHHYSPNTITISQLERHDFLNTGDLILFRGTDLKSLMIRFGSWCRYSHIGIIDRFNLGKQSVVGVFESVGEHDSCKCILTDRHKDGVRLVTLRDRLRSYIQTSYGGTVEICIVRLELIEATDDAVQGRAQEMARQLFNLENALCGRPYENNPLVVARSQYAWILGQNIHDTKRFFCSELVAYTYQAMGVLEAGGFEAATCSHKLFCNGYDFPFVNARLNADVLHYTVRDDDIVASSSAAAAATYDR